MSDGILDEALQRLHGTGPEWQGWLSNHAPMAAETLVHHGHGAAVHRWIDAYRDRLDEAPRGITPIDPEAWRDPLGDPVRTGDWTSFFAVRLKEAPWREVLATWWPRLLPGIAAGATHGVIRVGHAVRALLDVETAPRVTELGEGLAYWAARWQPLAPPGTGPYRATDPRSALDAVPRIPDQRFGIRSRLAQLAVLPAAPFSPSGSPGDGSPGDGSASAGSPSVVEARVAAIVEAAVLRHGEYGYGHPVLMVHAATAPLAVLRVLPALPPALAAPSLDAAWAAAAAVTAAYSPALPRPNPHAATSPADVLSRAADAGGAHAIKFADAAVEVWHNTGNPAALAAANQATSTIGDD